MELIKDPAGKGERDPEPRVSLADTAYVGIRRLIVSVRLWPGATFSEAEMVAELGLGKTPVREALLRLRLESLVEIRPRAGYQVAPVTLRGARDSLELRALLDAAAAGRCCERSGITTTMRDLHEETLAHAPTDIDARIDADRRFHLAMAHAGGNAALTESLDRCFTDYERLAHLAAAIDRASAPPLPDHSELLHALERSEGDIAREIVHREVIEAEQRITDALITSDSVASANVLPGSSSANKFYLDVPKSSGE